MVHESEGPVAGLASQNWVCVDSQRAFGCETSGSRDTCTSCPPGALKQHVLATTEVFWQLVCGLEHAGGDPPSVGLLVERRRN